MTQLRILASIRRHHEFDAAEAINELGGMAVVPRVVVWVPAPKSEFEYRPFLPNMLFLSVSEALWHHIRTKRIFGPQGVLPPVHRILDILPRTWADFTGFAERSEMECEVRMERHHNGLRVKRYKPGDMVRIVGEDLLAGQLRDKLAKFVRLDGDRLVAEVQGVEMMGRPVRVSLGPRDVEDWAAE